VIHVLAYDLKEPNDTSDDYARVISAIKSEFSSWCHIEKSVWVVDTAMDAQQARDHLKQFLNDKDVLFVARLSGNWGSLYFGKERNDWLQKRAF
jgi:hypothetical protein